MQIILVLRNVGVGTGDYGCYFKAENFSKCIIKYKDNGTGTGTGHWPTNPPSELNHTGLTGGLHIKDN